MEANDLLSLLRRMGGHWAHQKRDVPELFVVLDAWERGGALSFDVPSVARSLGTTPERLVRRLGALAPLGVLFLADGARGSVHLVARPGADARLSSHQSINIEGSIFPGLSTKERNATRAERVAGATRARVAGAQLRARDCSVLENTNVLSLSVLGPGKRAPLLAYTPEAAPWAWVVPSVSADLLDLIGGHLSSAELPATLNAVYSAADYLGGPHHVLPVVEAAIAAPPGGSFKGWAHYLRLDLGEYLTRRKLLDEYGAKRAGKRERETEWENQCDQIPQLRVLEVLAVREHGPGSVSLLDPHRWELKDGILRFTLPPHYPPAFRAEYLNRMNSVFSQAQTLTNLEIR